MFKHHRHSVFIPLLLLLCFLTACGQKQAEIPDVTSNDTSTADTSSSDEKNSLWIVTEKSADHTTNDIVKELIADYTESNPDISIELEILPEDVEERGVRLESLRAEIMAGDGPDVFLLPTANYGNRRLEHLFPDVVQSMHNGVFTDISALYDADTELNKEQLQTTIMDAGVLDGARYVLPLYFTFDTLLVDQEQLATYGISEEEITGSVKELFETVQSKNNHSLAVSTNPQTSEPGQYFPQLLDYEAGKVLVTAENIVEYLKLHYGSMALIYEGRSMDSVEGVMDSNPTSTTSYSSNNYYWQNVSHPVHIDPLPNALHSYVIAKAGGYHDFTAYPLRSSDGSVTADVTYWGAVSSGCDNVELAYDFLRLMLSEKVQWEIGRIAASAGLSTSFYAAGYPVRIHGSVEHLTTSVINMASVYKSPDDLEAQEQRNKLLESVQLTDDDFPLLDVEIDNVRFPFVWEIEFAYQRNISIEYDPFSVPSDEEIDEWAKELVRELEYHIAEG